MSYFTDFKNWTLFELNTLEWQGLLLCTFIVVYFGLELVKVIWNTWIGPATKAYVDLRKMGKWALITGATDGIGKAYAEEIAKLGINVILISRTLTKLKAVATEIEERFGVKTKVISIDFTEGVHIYEKIRAEIADLEVGTLINNVGMTYPYPEYFLDIPNGDRLCQDMIFCNIMSVTMMMRLVMPQMKERRKGVVVNVASISAISPAPLMCVYGASKAFMDKLSCDLAKECEDSGIVVQCLLPGYVATNMSRIRVSSYYVPSANEYASVALKTIGLQTRSAAYLPHRIMLFGVMWGQHFFPSCLNKFLYSTFQKMWLKAKKRSSAPRAFKNI